MTYGGDEKVILMGAIMRYMMLSFIPIWGISQGFQPLAGTNYGAKEYDRVKTATKVFGISATILALLFWVPFMLFTENILSWFITENTAIITNGLLDARMAYLIFPVSGLMIIFVTLFQSVGDAKKAGMLVMLRQVFLFIPLVLILPMVANLNSLGAFLSFTITDAIVCIISIIFGRKLFKSFDEERG